MMLLMNKILVECTNSEEKNNNKLDQPTRDLPLKNLATSLLDLAHPLHQYNSSSNACCSTPENDSQSITPPTQPLLTNKMLIDFASCVLNGLRVCVAT